MIPIHDSLTDGQSNAGSRVFIALCRRLKSPKMFYRYSGSMLIVYQQLRKPVLVLPLRSKVHGGRSFWAAVFYGVPNKVVKQLLQMRGIYRQRGQLAICDLSIAFGDSTC